MPIQLGAKVAPLPPMRDGRQIVIDALAAVKGGIELYDGHIRGLVEFAHPNGQDRVCEAVAILAHLCVDRNPNAIKEVFAAQRKADALRAKSIRTVDVVVNDFMDQIRDAKRAAVQRGEVFTIEDIRPIIEKALS